MEENLKISILAAIQAGNEIMKIYNGDDFNIEIKGDESPLTKADLESNKVITEMLEKTGIPIISEENKQLGYDERKDWNACWIVDPLDGTKEFIKRNGEFTVNIALISKNIPEYGVIYVPAEKTIYYGDGKNAWKQKLNSTNPKDFEHSESKKIAPKKIEGTLRVVGSRSHMNEDTSEFISDLENKYPGQEIEIVSKGSSLKFCLVAEGEADVYPRFAPTMEWDTAAGQAICQSAGLKVLDKGTGEQMVYNRKELLNNYFLVSNLG